MGHCPVPTPAPRTAEPRLPPCGSLPHSLRPCGADQSRREAVGGRQHRHLAFATRLWPRQRHPSCWHGAAAASNGGNRSEIETLDAAVSMQPDKLDEQLAADAVAAAASENADAAERQRLLALAKERVAMLKRTQAARQPAAGASRQPGGWLSASSSSGSTAAPAHQHAEATAERKPAQGSSSGNGSGGQHVVGPSRGAGLVASKQARNGSSSSPSASAAWAPAAGQAPAFPPKKAANKRRVQRSTETVDAKRYEQVVASRNRLAAQLSDTNRYVAHLQAELAARSSNVSGAADALAKVSAELAQLLRAAGLAAGDAAPGANGGHAMAQQLARLQQQVGERQRRLDDCALHTVPLVWVGVAQEVQLMGSFDGWSKGVALSSREGGGDSVFRRFEGALQARKGEYLVKFKVDGEWRLAPDWPTRDDDAGSTNNVLRVD